MQLIKSKIGIWLPHIIGVVFILAMPMFVFGDSDNHLIFWKYTYYYHMFFMIVAFYINYWIIVPRLYFSKKKVYFFLVLLLFAILILVILQESYNWLGFDDLRDEMGLKQFAKPERESNLIHPKLIDNFYLLILVLSSSTGAAIIRYVKQDEKFQLDKEKAHQDTELAFLKNQISPHFFFNALNNIYALIAIDSDKAQESVEKLSGLMRYLIYESDIKTIDLQKEFEFTRNYIDLMQQRLTSKVKLDVNITNHVSSKQIPPLLFIPFVENAFKHGVSYREESYIQIKLCLEDDKVVFECKNSISQKKNAKEVGGVGIVNIKKRLELIYGNQVSLKMDSDQSVFKIYLVVPV